MMKIPLSNPDISEKEIKAVIDVLKTPNLSLGPRLAEFEQKFAAYIGSKHAIAVNSGTAGLHLAVNSLGIGPDDAVITTSFSFIASANCILYEKALPIFIDIDPGTLNIDDAKLNEFLDRDCITCKTTGRTIHRRTGRVVKAILPVHVFGRPCNMSRIMALAQKHHLFVIEDACEAIGADYGGQKLGGFGNLGVFAFYPNKQMTTGEGGMIVTNDKEVARRCASLRNQGRDLDGGWLSHRRLGFNYRLSEINCALGIVQLERIEEILAKRTKVAKRYNELLDGIVPIRSSCNDGTVSWFVYVICLPDSFSKKERDAVLDELLQEGIGCNNYFPPIHLQPVYRNWSEYQAIDLAVTEAISTRTIALPFYTNIQDQEILHVVDTLKRILAKFQKPFAYADAQSRTVQQTPA